MPRNYVALTLLFAAVAPPAVNAAPSLSHTEYARGIGLELAGIDTSVEVNGLEAQANGTVGGIYGYLQRGATFRAEGRLLTGSLDADLDAPGDTMSVTLADVQATVGTATGNNTRLYAGLGAQYLTGDSPYGSGDGESWSLYVPAGFSRADSFSADWRVLVSVEAKFLLTGSTEVDDIPGIGDAEFDSDGGWGLGISAQFRNSTSGVEIEPWVEVTHPADSDVENVGGTDVQLEEAETTSGGVRMIWTF